VPLALSLLWTSTAGAQAPAATAPGTKANTLAGRCGSANWVCVSQCIDVTCVDRCLVDSCEKPLDELIQCAAKAKCAPDDSDCVANACGKQCEKTFEPAPKSPEKELAEPCARPEMNAGEVPKGLAGTWVLEAASLKQSEKVRVAKAEEGKDVKPRADYKRSMVVTPGGCFLLSTQLEGATLGKGNALAVRSWGPFQVDKKKHTVQLLTQDGQAVGPVCGKTRVTPLSKGKFQQPLYEYELEKDTLALTLKARSKQTFQFHREPQETQVQEKKAE
jgi:hypothetical protein